MTRSPLERLALATDGLDAHVSEAILLIAAEMQGQLDAALARCEAQAAELRLLRRQQTLGRLLRGGAP